MRQTLKNILYLLPKGDRFKLLILFIMMLVGSMVEVVGIGVIPAFIAIVVAPDTVLGFDLLQPIIVLFGIKDSSDLLVFGAIFLIVVFIFKNSYLIFYNYIKARYIYSRFAFIGSSLFKMYLYGPYVFHLNNNTSVLLRNINQEALFLSSQVITPTLQLMKESITLVAIFTTLFIIEPILTVGVILLIGFVGGSFLKVVKTKTNNYGKMAQKDRGLMIKTVNEGLGGLKELRVLNRETYFYKEFLKSIKSYSLSQTYRELVAKVSKPIIETIAMSGMLLITLFLYWQGRGLEAVISVLALFAIAAVRIMPAVQGIVHDISILRYYSHVVDPIYKDTALLSNEMLDGDLIIKTKGKLDNNIFLLKKEVRFDNVSFNYPGDDMFAISNISLSIPKGSVVGIVGSSGAGKTTLIDLLLGLLKPHQGVIMVDGYDIQSDLSSWQRTVGYVPQFIFLSDDTIKRNIAFGLPDEKIEEEKLLNAMEAAQLASFVHSLPNGFDTIIGERGTRLSGGQRQRIGIARALYHKPQILIMDEATSSLDNLTEKYIVEAIERLKGDRTVVIIAHRMSTVQNCGKLYLMDSGNIIDSGSYKDLLGRNKKFYNLTFAME